MQEEKGFLIKTPQRMKTSLFNSNFEMGPNCITQGKSAFFLVLCESRAFCSHDLTISPSIQILQTTNLRRY